MSEQSALDAMHAVAPRDWWRFVPCGYCNSPRQEPCMGPLDLAHRPHVARMRSAYALYMTLWLIRNGYEADVLRADA